MCYCKSGRLLRISVSLLGCLILGIAYAGLQAVYNPTMLKHLQAYSPEAVQRGQQILTTIKQLQTESETRQVTQVNALFNRVRYQTDQQLWQQMDYWATPYEFIGHNAGDCEDFVIAKFFLLQQLGVDTDKLYLTYVKVNGLSVAHMVLTYFPAPDAVPWVLDNYHPDVLPATERSDLMPVYSFNVHSLFLTTTQAEIKQSLPINKVKNSHWTQLLARMRAHQ